MLDQAGIRMAQGNSTASERVRGVNDNMSRSHYHDYFEVYYLEEGERYHVVRDQVYRMRPGEFMVFAPYVMHRSFGEQNVPFRRLLLYFRKEQLLSERLLAELRQTGGIYRPGDGARSVYRVMEQLLEVQQQEPKFQREKNQLLINGLALLVTEQRADFSALEEKSPMGNVIDYIHKHYNEDLNLEGLAQKFYISPYYLCRKFKEYTNRTLVQYVNITRIMNAQRMFLETDKRVTDVSRATGFSNITHFNRVFKSVTGMTPSGFRKSNRIGGEL